MGKVAELRKLIEDKLPGGKGDNANPADFDQEEIKMGIEVEMEHTNDREIAMEIVLDHLSEDPHYYTNLKNAHVEAKLGEDGAQIAKEILSQLGGNKFVAMTGAKNLAHGPDYLSFKIGKNSGGVTHVKIRLDKGKDLYDMTFYKVRGAEMKTLKDIKGVQVGDMAKIFTDTTGLHTSLGTMGK